MRLLRARVRLGVRTSIGEEVEALACSMIFGSPFSVKVDMQKVISLVGSAPGMDAHLR